MYGLKGKATVTTRQNYESIVKVWEANGYRYHHTGSRCGYVGVDLVEIYDYKGRFGEGYAVYYSDYKESTRFANVDYYVKGEY